MRGLDVRVGERRDHVEGPLAGLGECVGDLGGDEHGVGSIASGSEPDDYGVFFGPVAPGLARSSAIRFRTLGTSLAFGASAM